MMKIGVTTIKRKLIQVMEVNIFITQHILLRVLLLQYYIKTM